MDVLEAIDTCDTCVYVIGNPIRIVTGCFGKLNLRKQCAPSPMVKTRPVSCTSPPREVPAIRDSRIVETSEAAVVANRINQRREREKTRQMVRKKISIIVGTIAYRV